MDIVAIILISTLGSCFTILPLIFLLGGVKKYTSVSRRCLYVIATISLVYGGLSFMGSAFSCFGGLNWLSKSFEWPVGYADQVLPMENGILVVGLPNCGRVQVYDRDKKFLLGWHADMTGGTFKLIAAKENRFEVITARRQWRYLFDLGGNLLSQGTYSPASYDSFPKQGWPDFFPTSIWLWGFTSPLFGWVFILIGGVLFNWTDKLGKRKNKGVRPTT